MIEALFHANMNKTSDGVYHFHVRSVSFANRIIDASEPKGLKVMVCVHGFPKYHANKRDLWEDMKSKYEILNEYEKELGLSVVV